MLELTDKVALITGGSRGIGAAVARRLASDGADVVVTYLNAVDDAQAVVASIEASGRRALAVRADSADPAAIQSAVAQTAEAFGRIDIVVNNAGIFPYGPPEEMTPEDVDRTLAIHVRAVFLTAQAALPHMERGGRFVSIGSCFVERVPVEGITLYAMSKSALIGFTKGLARDLGPRGITVNLVHPGPTDTDMNPASGSDADSERAFTALGRYGSGDDIAATVAHLASRGGRHITGASIAVDGGYAA